MKLVNPPALVAVADFCARIGKDALLVQGAGGNASFKQADTLWVKASGTWLADANQQDIFVPVDLQILRSAVARGDYDIKPVALGDSQLRPSIETLLHALMPHTIVLHLHMVEALVHLVHEDCLARLRERLGDFEDWALVDYHKPGAPLAQAVAEQLKERPGAGAVFLRNHGVVVGGETLEDIEALLQLLSERLHAPPALAASQAHDRKPVTGHALPGDSLLPLRDDALADLVFDDLLFERLKTSWALYPDHVVFLGPAALTYESEAEYLGRPTDDDGNSYPVFIRNTGVFAPPAFNRAKHEQLRCYRDVVVRLPRTASAPVACLSHADIAALLDWDAEIYRLGNAK